MLVVGCGRPAPRAPDPLEPPAEPAVRLIRTDRPSARPDVARPALVRECTAPGQNGATVRRFDIELDELRVEPLAFGPRIAELPRDGAPRRLRPFERALEARRDALTACYRWARYQRPELAGDVALALAVDVWGVVTDLAVTPRMAGGDALAGCVQDSLRGLALPQSITPRRTRADLVIRFSPSGQRRPARRPARPPAPSAEAARPDACLRRPADVPEDQLPSRVPVLELSDFSQAQAQADARAAHRRWVRGGRRGRQPSVPPTVTIGQSIAHGAPLAPHQLRERVGFQLGALRQCYGAAIAAAPGVQGKLGFVLEVDAAGTVRAVTRGGGSIGGEDLVACLQHALAELWFEPVRTEPPAELRVRVNFVLAPPAGAPISPLPAVASIGTVETWINEALARGDGDGTMHAAVALIEQAGDHPHQCRACSRSTRPSSAPSRNTALGRRASRRCARGSCMRATRSSGRIRATTTRRPSRCGPRGRAWHTATCRTRARAQALLRHWPDGDVAAAAKALLGQTAPASAP